MRYTLYATAAGNAINTALPNAILLATYTFPEASNVQGLHLQTLVLSANATPVVVAALNGTGAQSSVRRLEGGAPFLVHGYGQGAAGATSGAAAQHQISAKLFGEGVAMFYAAGESISLYAAAPNDAAVVVYAWLTLEYELA